MATKKVNRKFTHTGELIGDARTLNKNIVVKLRETANFWVTEKGTKFRKSSGWQANAKWSQYSLDLKSIKPITN